MWTELFRHIHKKHDARTIAGLYAMLCDLPHGKGLGEDGKPTPLMLCLRDRDRTFFTAITDEKRSHMALVAHLGLETKRRFVSDTPEGIKQALFFLEAACIVQSGLRRADDTHIVVATNQFRIASMEACTYSAQQYYPHSLEDSPTNTRIVKLKLGFAGAGSELLNIDLPFTPVGILLKKAAGLLPKATIERSIFKEADVAIVEFLRANASNLLKRCKSRPLNTSFADARIKVKKHHFGLLTKSHGLPVSWDALPDREVQDQPNICIVFWLGTGMTNTTRMSSDCDTFILMDSDNDLWTHNHPNPRPPKRTFATNAVDSKVYLTRGNISGPCTCEFLRYKVELYWKRVVKPRRKQ